MFAGTGYTRFNIRQQHAHKLISSGPSVMSFCAEITVDFESMQITQLCQQNSWLEQNPSKISSLILCEQVRLYEPMQRTTCAPNNLIYTYAMAQMSTFHTISLRRGPRWALRVGELIFIFSPSFTHVACTTRQGSSPTSCYANLDGLDLGVTKNAAISKAMKSCAYLEIKQSKYTRFTKVR